MLRSVPMGRSFFGCGTVTAPGFSGCLNLIWLPSKCALRHPSDSSLRTISALFMCVIIHNYPLAGAGLPPLRNGTKKEEYMSSTGNEVVFHGSFQTSRLIFPGGGKRLGEMAESGLIAMATKRSREIGR